MRRQAVRRGAAFAPLELWQRQIVERAKRLWPLVAWATHHASLACKGPHVIDLTEPIEPVAALYSRASTCMIWSVAAIVAGIEHGRGFTLNAGTAMWRTGPRREDWFGYEYGGSAEGRVAVEGGDIYGRPLSEIPEFHMWALDCGPIDAQYEPVAVVDLAAGYQRERARRCGIKWTGPALPDQLWYPVRDLAGGTRVIYRADRAFTDEQLEHVEAILRLVKPRFHEVP